MFISSFRRSRRRRLGRIALFSVVGLVFLDLFSIFRSYKTFSLNLAANTVTHLADLPKRAQNQKIFICAQFWTSADVLTAFWGPALLELVNVLGPENVYISLLESGSLDNTAEWVRYIDARLAELNVQRTVVLDPKTHEDAIDAGPLDEHGKDKQGWIVSGEPEFNDTKQLRRIPYLAEVRNDILEPMLRMYRDQGRKFDKVLYLNDVAFKPSDILTLLATNEGSYDVACGIDFHYPPAIYDTFAARDTDGNGPVMTDFPYFRSAATRNSLLEGNPAEVLSCWNGVIAVDAEPYYDRLVTLPNGAARFVKGLRFRGVPDSLALHRLEASECCLIHADLIASGEARKGLFINPAVRVGYTTVAYDLTHQGPEQRFLSLMQYMKGVMKSRFARWKLKGANSSAGQNMGEVYKRIRKWQTEGDANGEKRKEVGGYCTIQEMHLLIWNGWKHA